ncbi:XdhC family protein [Halorubrum sp. Ea8]|uniref:XdhC family protein n=1 Tax=Halorubrum sp. Ea8 TaxID=1383841 RepID=UPI000B97CB44|nr:XdhC family protein [Halorubrum sp. Ea8]OYR52565.1 xanthine dehydrogenase [Halorubrum sp. Ea8]
MTHDETEHDETEHGEADEPAIDGGERPERDEPSGTATGTDDGDVSDLEAALAERGEPYARATIVRREPPVSANVGDRAVVTADGEIHGWVGGAACAQSIVATQGAAAIEEGSPRLVGIAPDPDTVDRPGLDAFPMTCHSEGVLELFIEPVTPTTELVAVGDSPVTRSLARLADELAVDVTLVVADADADRDVPASTRVLDTVDHEAIADAVGPGPLVVVASMGEYDARGVAAGILADAPYVGLVASDERAAEVTERAAGLLDSDVGDVVAAVTNPAGVDVAAYTPAAIAASLLAEVVGERSKASSVRAGGARGTGGAVGTGDTAAVDSADDDGSDDRTAEMDDGSDDRTAAADDATAIDPVCGMTVDPATADASVEHDGETYHFCCHGCADSFANDPASYLEGAEA